MPEIFFWGDTCQTDVKYYISSQVKTDLKVYV